MQSIVYVLEKIFQPMFKKENFPFLQVFDEKFQESSELFNDERFEHRSNCLEWKRLLVEVGSSLELSSKKYIVFSDNQELSYCMREVLVDNQKLGTVIIGGFSIPNAKERIEKVHDYLNEQVKELLLEVDLLIFQIFETLINNLQERYTLKKLAKIHYCSESRIQRCFLKSIGTTFSQFYLELKMDIALELFEKSYKTHEVSEKLGYYDTSNFKRAFDRHTEYKGIMLKA